MLTLVWFIWFKVLKPISITHTILVIILYWPLCCLTYYENWDKESSWQHPSASDPPHHHLTLHDTVTGRASRAPHRVGLVCQLSEDMATWLKRDFFLHKYARFCLWKTGAHNKKIIPLSGRLGLTWRNKKIQDPVFWQSPTSPPHMIFYFSFPIFGQILCVLLTDGRSSPQGKLHHQYPKSNPHSLFFALCHTLFSSLVTLQPRAGLNVRFPGFVLMKDPFSHQQGGSKLNHIERCALHWQLWEGVRGDKDG